MKGPIICIGAALVDELFFCAGEARIGTSNPAIATRKVGGVMSNVARHLAMLNLPVQLLAVLSDDADGEFIQYELLRSRVRIGHILFSKEPTGKYSAILHNDGSLFSAACSDVSSLYLTPEFLGKKAGLLLGAGAIVADTNISSEALHWLSVFCKENNIPLFIETVSVAKAQKLASIDLSGVYMITPNEEELSLTCLVVHKQAKDCIDELLGRGVRYVWLRKGEQGSILFSLAGGQALAAQTLDVIDSTGAGDSALAGWIAARYKGWDDLKCMKAGHSMAFEVLQYKGAILDYLNDNVFQDLLDKYYADDK